MIRSFTDEAQLPLTQSRLRLLCESSLTLPPRERNDLTNRLCQEMLAGRTIEVNEEALGIFSIVLHRAIYAALDQHVALTDLPFKYIEAIAIPVLLSQAHTYTPYKPKAELEPKFNTLPIQLFLESKFPEDKFIVEERLLAEQRLVSIPTPNWAKHMQAIAHQQPSDLLNEPAQEPHQGPGTTLRPRVVLAYRLTNNPITLSPHTIPEAEVIKAFNIATDKVEFPAAGGQGTMHPHAIGGFRPLHSALNHIRFYLTMQILEANAVQIRKQFENQPVELVISRRSMLEARLFFKLTSNPKPISPEILHYLDPCGLEAESKTIFEFAQANGLKLRLEDSVLTQLEYSIKPITPKGKRQWFRQRQAELPAELKHHKLLELLKHLIDRPASTRKQLKLIIATPQQTCHYTDSNWEDILLDGLEALENNAAATEYQFAAYNQELHGAGLNLTSQNSRPLDPKELLHLVENLQLQVPMGYLLPKLSL